jgi:hypothetical protein
MMDEERRKEAQRKLTEEERVSRLREGGESMRAQLAMEDAQRSSQGAEGGGSEDYLTPQETQQRRMMRETGDPNRGLGETQQAEQAMWNRGSGASTVEELRLREETLRNTPPDTDRPKTISEVQAPAGSGFGMSPASMSGREPSSARNLTMDEMRRTGSDRTDYGAGTGSYYSETFVKPTGSATDEKSSGWDEVTRMERERASEDNRRMGEMRRTGSDRTDFPAGTGSYYSETFVKPTGSATDEKSSGWDQIAASDRRRMEAGRRLSMEEMRRTGSDQTNYPAGTGSYYSETFVKPTGSATDERSSGWDEVTRMERERATESNRRMEEMRRTGSDRTDYPAGSGSYYSETFVKPTGSATDERSSGWDAIAASDRRRMEAGMRGQEMPTGRNLTMDEMRRTGSDQVNYPAGGGSYYNETFERPVGSAGPESSFGRTERIPSGRQYAESETMQGRMGAYPAAEPGPTGRMGKTAAATTGMVKERGGQASEMMKEKGGQAMDKSKEVGTTVVSKTKGVSSQLSTRAKEFSQKNPPEDVAHRAGESLGRAIRKTVAVAREMTSGFRKGLNPEKHEEPPGEMRSEGMVSERGAEGEMAPRVEHETIQREESVQQTPRGQEKKYQEVRRSENE